MTPWLPPQYRISVCVCMCALFDDDKNKWLLQKLNASIVQQNYTIVGGLHYLCYFFAYQPVFFATSVFILVRYVGPDRLQLFIARTRLQNYMPLNVAAINMLAVSSARYPCKNFATMIRSASQLKWGVRRCRPWRRPMRARLWFISPFAIMLLGNRLFESISPASINTLKSSTNPCIFCQPVEYLLGTTDGRYKYKQVNRRISHFFLYYWAVYVCMSTTRIIILLFLCYSYAFGLPCILHCVLGCHCCC